MGVQLPSEPITRKEQYLAKAAGQAVEIPAEPITREEAYLDAIAKGGSGGGGTTNYNSLSNKPQIGGVELQGNKSLADLGIASASALANKVDKVEGKGLSTNDFTDAYKTAIGDNTNAINGIKDGTTIDSFSDVETALATKQKATDNNLNTDAKTIVGAINEHEGDIDSLKSGLTTLDNEVNGDATTYPYADVITINDAVPANLADCSVKIEPVQDLHGYDKPWVGGAGTNKLPINNDVATQSDSGITWFMDNGSMSIDGTASSTVRNESGNYALAVASYVIKGTEYFKLFCGGGNFSGALGLRLYFTDNTYIEAIRTRAQDTVIIKSLSTHVGKTVKGIGYYINSGCVFDHNTYSMAIVENEDDTWTPYENICPISGHTEAVVTRDGKNLIDLADVTGTSGTVYGATNLLPAGTYYGYFFAAYQAWNHFYQYSLDGVNFTNFPTTDDGYAVADNSSGTYYHEKNKLTIHHPSYIRFGIQKNSAVGDNSVDALLTVDSTYYNEINDFSKTGSYYPKMYQPYAGKTYTLALGDTIYGGTVDFDTGVMTVDRAYYTIASASDFRNNQGSFPSSAYVIDVDPVGKNNGDIISNKYEQSSGGVGVFLNSSGKVRINTNESYESKDAALSGELSGVQIVYELATPTTIQLTPQQIQLLQGTNTLYASTGDISVSVNGVSGAIGAVQEQANATDNALAQLAADIAEQLPDAPTTDGAYVLTVTVADGEATYSWESAE